MPINKGDKRVPIEIIKEYQSLFRTLSDWKIEPIEDREVSEYQHNGQVVINDKYMGIYPCPAVYADEPLDIEEYVFHEMLHALFKSVQNRDTEELAVQDICRFIKFLKDNQKMI